MTCREFMILVIGLCLVCMSVYAQHRCLGVFFFRSGGCKNTLLIPPVTVWSFMIWMIETCILLSIAYLWDKVWHIHVWRNGTCLAALLLNETARVLHIIIVIKLLFLMLLNYILWFICWKPEIVNDLGDWCCNHVHVVQLAVKSSFHISTLFMSSFSFMLFPWCDWDIYQFSSFFLFAKLHVSMFSLKDCIFAYAKTMHEHVGMVK